MANTPVLNLEVVDFSEHGSTSYANRVEDENVVNGNQSKLDAFSGLITGSQVTRFTISTGSVSDQLGDQGVVGAEFNRSSDRVILEVVAFAASSGSGGVTRVDVQIQQGTVMPANLSSIFSNNAFKPAVSSSLGNFGPARSSTFVSGSDMVWRAGTVLAAVLDTAAGAPGPSGQKGLVVDVFWKPSGSYA